MTHQVLLLHSDDEPLDDVAAAFTAAGHQVRICHRSGESPFPCNGLRADDTCPLDEGVDVAVDVRHHPWPRPTPLEDGVTCALRRRVPVVVAGRTLFHPFADYATVTIEGTSDVVAAAERAVELHLGTHRRAAITAVEEVLDRAGVVGVLVDATATRAGRHLHVEVTADLPAGLLRSMAAARIGAALRQVDTEADAIEISFSPSS